MALKVKSYHKFIASSAAVALVATAVSPAQAATPFTDVSDRYKEAVDYLVKEYITKGISETKFGTDLSIKRVDAAVMIAKALELDTSNAPDSGFTDVPARAKAQVDALKEQGIINGKTATSFGSDQDITRGEMALILARAYQLSGDTSKLTFTDVAPRYVEAVAALVEHEVTLGKTKTSFGTIDSVTRGEFALFLYRLAPEKEAVVEEAPKVTGVSALNATQIEVKFNHELNDDQTAGNAEDRSVYSLNNVKPSKAELADDKKSVVLTFAKGAEVQDGVVVVNPVVSNQKDEGGNWLQTAKFTTVFSYQDTVKPAVTGTSYSNDKITVTFSEAIGEKPAVVRVNGENVPAEEFNIHAQDPTKVEINYTLDPSESVSLYVAGAKDKANTPNEMPLFNGTVTAPAADTNKPHVTNINITGQNTAKVTLNEKVTQNRINVTLQRGADQTTAVLVKDTSDASGQTYNLNVDMNGNEPGDGIFEGESVSETFTMYLKKDAATDASGLGNEAFETTLTFLKDTEAPKLVSSQVSADGETFEFTFSEAINVQGEISKIDVRSTDGIKWNALASTAVKEGDPNTYQVDILEDDKKVAPGSYKVAIPAEFFADQYGNKAEAVADTFTVGKEEVKPEEDTVKPTASVEATDTANVFLVKFSEEVTTTALEKGNYELDGKKLPADTDIHFTDTSKTKVAIKLPAGSINIGDQETGVPAVLAVSGVADKAGNVMNAVNFIVAVKDNTPATITNIDHLNKVVAATFSEDVIIDLPEGTEAIDANDVFNIKVDGKDAEAGNVTVVDGKPNQLQFTLANTLNGKLTVEVKDNQTNVKDKNGVLVK